MEEKRLTPIKAIRAKCLDCCCGNPYEVKECPLEKCALHPYRMGKNPNIRDSGWTEERRAAQKAKMSEIRKRQLLEKSAN